MLAVTLIGLALLGLVLWWLVWLVMKILPMNAFPLGRISRSYQRQRSPNLIFAMVALFVGVISLGFGAVIVESGKNVMGAVQGDQTGENVAIYASPVDEATIEQVIQNAHIQGYSFSRQYEVKEVRYTGNKDASYASTLMARTDPGSYKVTGAEWGTRPNGVYVRDSY